MRKSDALDELRDEDPTSLRQLKILLADVLSPAEEWVLAEVRCRRARVEDFVEWLEHAPATWQEYQTLCAEHATSGWLRLMAYGFVPWADVEPDAPGAMLQQYHVDTRRTAVRRATPCPRCHTPSNALRWLYYRSEPWTWREGRGQEGWVAVCDACRLQVAFFPGVTQLMPSEVT